MRPPFALCLALGAPLRTISTAHPALREQLQRGPGGVVAVDVEAPALSLRLRISPLGLELISDYESPVDLQLSGGLADFLALGEGGHDALLDGRVKASGDLALATALQQMIAVLGDDWEAPLESLIGDTAAHKLGRATRGAALALGEFAVAGGRQLSDYLQGEAALLVGRDSWREHERAADALRSQLDRIEARLQGRVG